MNWKIGEIAVCIKTGPLKPDHTSFPPLRLNADYIVQNIYQCPKCKKFSLDVGISSRLNAKGQHVGTECCTERIPCIEIHWCASERFAKKKTKEEQIEEAIKEENYELAEQLKNS